MGTYHQNHLDKDNGSRKQGSRRVRERIGLQQLMEEMIMERQMQWLGHLARMEDHRMPIQALFRQLRKTRPFHGVKMRWKDRAKRDMTSQ